MPVDQSIVAQWNEVMLGAIRDGGAKPTATTYQLHLTTAAMYDAWSAYDQDAYGHYGEITRPVGEHTEANKAEAISHAAYRMLIEFFPDQLDRFDAFMDELGYDPADTGTDPATASGVGNLAAQNVWATRADDGSNYEGDFADTSGYVPVNDPDPDGDNAPGQTGFDPNSWQPLRVPNGTLVDDNGVPVFDNDDPSTYVDQVALTPHWGDVLTFALASGDQFRPDAPPQLGDFSTYVDARGNVTTNDQAYRDQFTEVLNYSRDLDNWGKVVAEYWADGPRTESPPGHWNQIAQDIALREGHGIDEDAKMFFALNAAMFDAGIATWEAKYHYDFIRPQSAIHNLFFNQVVQAWGGPNEGTQTMLGQDWRPYQNLTFVTPPFPEYISGHSAFSMSAARTIASFVGSDVFYDGSTFSNYDLDDVPGIDLLGQYVATELAFEQFEGDTPVVLQWETLTEAAEEAGISRLYGGIHVMDGNLRSLEVGRQVAAEVQIRWDALFTRGGDDTIICDPSGGLVIAGAGNDMVQGDRGADLIEGGSGNDVLFGARRADTLLGGAGADFLCGNRGRDLLVGGDGMDILRGRLGADILDGGAGSDDLYGGRGSNILIGGKGRDILRGGQDADCFVFDADDGPRPDSVRRFDADQDRLLLQGFAPEAEVEFAQVGSNTAVLVDDIRIATLKSTIADDLVVDDIVTFDDTPLV